MRIVFIGSGEFGIPSLKWVLASEHEVPLIISQPPKPSGRGRSMARTPIARYASKADLEVLETEDINSPEAVRRVRSLDARVGLVIAFGQKLGPELLSSMPGGCINLHASLLPKYRGAAPINWAIAKGEEKTGCTVFRIVQRMDAGPILSSRWTFIKPDETAGELHDRLAAIGVDAVQAALELFDGNGDPAGTPQDDGLATVAPKLTKRMGSIDFSMPAQQIVHHVHAMTPWPGARARYQSHDDRWEVVTFLRVRPAETLDAVRHPAGTIDDRLYVAAGDHYVEVLELKPSSGRVMTWQDYVNGRRVVSGDRFIDPYG